MVKSKFKKRKDGKYDTGRPSKITPETKARLIEAFSKGCSDLEACIFAGISKTALYDYQNSHPEFADQKAALKERPALHARMLVNKYIEQGDIDTAKWYLERKKKAEFSTRRELVGEDGEPLAVNISVVGVDETNKGTE